MKIVLLEPLGIPAEVLAQYQAAWRPKAIPWFVTGRGPQTRRSSSAVPGDSDIAILANTPYPASVVEGASQLKLLNVAFTGVDHVALEASRPKGSLYATRPETPPSAWRNWRWG